MGTALVAASVVVASPLFAQERSDGPPAGGTGRTETPTPKGETEPPRATPVPRTDSERLTDLERKITEQAREIERLKLGPAGPRADEKGERDPAEPRFEWGFKDGFFVKGKIHGAPYELRPIARLELDYRGFPHAIANDQFLVRRARLGFRGTFTDFACELEVDPARAPANVLPLGQFWLQYQPQPELNVRFGHYIAPFSLDDTMSSDLYDDFVAVPMAIGFSQQLASDFAPGALFWGGIGGKGFGTGFFQYYLSVQNETDALSGVTSSQPYVAARLASEIGGLLVGAAGSWERRPNVPAAGATPASTQLSFRGTTPGQFTFFAPVLVRGWTQRYEVDASYYQGPFWIRAVYGYGEQERWRVLSDHGSATDLVLQGTSVTFGFLFVGLPRDAKHPVGASFKDWELFNLDLEKSRRRNVGAEITCRLEWVVLDRAGGARESRGGLPSGTPVTDTVRGNDCKAVSVGLNLFPTENVKFMADWVHLRIGDQARSEKLHGRFADEFLLRAQVEF